jgi:hypothetical protein
MAIQLVAEKEEPRDKTPRSREEPACFNSESAYMFVKMVLADPYAVRSILHDVAAYLVSNNCVTVVNPEWTNESQVYAGQVDHMFNVMKDHIASAVTAYTMRIIEMPARGAHYIATPPPREHDPYLCTPMRMLQIYLNMCLTAYFEKSDMELKQRTNVVKDSIASGIENFVTSKYCTKLGWFEI